MRRLSPCSLAALVLLASAPAAAETVMVAKVEGRVLEHARLIGKYTGALRAAARRSGVKVQASGSTFAQLRAMGGCAIGDASCRRLLVGSLLVDEVVGCTVSRGLRDNKLRARLTRIRGDGAMASRVVVIAGKTRGAQLASFRKQAAAFLRADIAKAEPPPPPVVEAKTEPEPAPDVVVAPKVDEPTSKTEPGVGDGGLVNLSESESETESGSETATESETESGVGAEVENPMLISSESDSGLGSVRGRTWIAFAAGATLAVGAGVSLALARGRQDDIDNAAVQSEADLIELERIEDSARLRYNIANVAGIAAAGALVVGGVFLVLDLRANKRSKVAIAPTRGGLSVALGASW